MDGFQVRLQLVSILRKLSSSQNSIQSTVRFLLKHKDKYGEDLWDCLIEEAEKVTYPHHIIFLDTHNRMGH
jgi:CTD kinase subunit gamma